MLEKNDVFGDKICAGGLTRKSLSILKIPDHIIEHKIYHTVVYSKHFQSNTKSPVPLVFTINRKDLAMWQKNQLINTNVEILTKAKVTQIDQNKIVVNGNTEYGFRYLVGADGAFSIVRKHLKIPVEKRLIGIQYVIPFPAVPRLEIYFNSKLFHSWYAWIFHHKESISVGCECDPKIMSSGKLKTNFKKWLDEKAIDISRGQYQSCPISYDYRGFKFNNIFLAGEAAGLASGPTGEGIYQALVSGREVAKIILDENYVSQPMEEIIRYNSIQNKTLKYLSNVGPLQNLFHDILIILLNNKKFKTKLTSSFS